MNLLVHIDGGSRGNPGPAGAGVVVVDADTGRTVHEAGYYLGRMTNNVAEYNGLLRALDAIEGLGPERILIRSDSQLMVRQLEGRYRVKSPALRPLYEKVRGRLAKLDCRIEHVPREDNHRADDLANRAMDARRDVAIGTDAGAGPAAEDGPPQGEAAASWEVWLDEAPGPACPAPPTRGRRLVLGPAVPANLCMFAAAAMLNECLAQLAADGPATACTHCPRCRARIRMRPR